MKIKALLQAYRSLWNNRLLDSGDNDETILREAITRELRDENSHPRIRKGRYEKFYSATKRIMASELPAPLKEALVQIHIEEFEKLT